MHPPRPIIGHIRFSVYGVTDTKLRPDRANATLARLYDETRMARRFFLFERLTLPSLLAQTDQDFRVVIMSSDVMPDPLQRPAEADFGTVAGRGRRFLGQPAAPRACR